MKAVVLLDYETNGDVEDLSSPLSHAALVRYYLEGKWPAAAGAAGAPAAGADAAKAAPAKKEEAKKEPAKKDAKK